MARPDRQFRTDAVILRRQDFKEYDRLVTVFSPEFGKFTVIAKGVRKPTGRMTGHVELFTRAQMLVARGRDLDILNQCEMSDPYLPIRENLDRAAYAHYIVELLDRFTEHDEAYPALFGLLCETLTNLASVTTDATDLRITARHYELGLLTLVGFQPELFDCVVGHEELEPIDQYFSAFDGGVVCPEHAENNPHVQPLSLGALKALRYLQVQPFEMVYKLKLNDVLHLELERILQSYIVYTLERRLKSVDFIRRLRYSG